MISMQLSDAAALTDFGTDTGSSKTVLPAVHACVVLKEAFTARICIQHQFRDGVCTTSMLTFAVEI